ncbi:hypothetical protein [Halobacillus litoralis]|uniref:hypothetical protein n=1 Tax=Halobacillus litoralis TaxID=45668 RepID=UPI001CFCFE32|nr:hypothetical protein [Halobacillus litoralis]
MEWKGKIISGEFEDQGEDFILHQVKHFSTTSTLNESQVNSIYNYLSKAESDRDGQILTLNDQMLIRLSQEEIRLVMDDLEYIRSQYE